MERTVTVKLYNVVIPRRTFYASIQTPVKSFSEPHAVDVPVGSLGCCHVLLSRKVPRNASS